MLKENESTDQVVTTYQDFRFGASGIGLVDSQQVSIGSVRNSDLYVLCHQ